MALGSWIRPEKRWAIYLRDGQNCVYCEANLRNVGPQDVTIDHLVPRLATRKQTGSLDNEPSNLVTCCRRCNTAKADKPVKPFASPSALRRIAATVRKPLDVDGARLFLAKRRAS